MNYLKYIEYSAENLQFFLWHQAYTKKFEALPASERALSPEWTLTKAESEALASQHVARQMKISADTAAAIKGTGLDSTPTVNESEKGSNPFFTPPRTPSGESKRQDTQSMFSATESTSIGWSSVENTALTKKRAEGAYDEAGLKWQPCKHSNLMVRRFH